MITCLAFTSLFFAYPSYPLLTKKTTLGLNAVIYINWFLTPALGLKYAVQLGGTTVFGAVCAVAAMLLPFPQLARQEVRQRSAYAGEGVGLRNGGKCRGLHQLVLPQP